MKKPNKDSEIQLFPPIDSTSKIFMPKDYYKNFLDHKHSSELKKKYEKILSMEIENKKTVLQVIENQENWLNNLSYKDLEYFIKLFGFIQNVKNHIFHVSSENFYFKELQKGIFDIKVETDNDFYKHFLRKKRIREGFMGYHTRDKKFLLQWLWENQKEFDIIMETKEQNKLFLLKTRIYQMISEIGNFEEKKQIILRINTNIIPMEFKDYLEISPSIFDEIDSRIDFYKDSSQYVEMNKLDSISNYYDIILKFYLTLKTIYHRDNTRKLENGLIVNVQTLKAETLDIKLGYLKEKIKKNLHKRQRIGDNSKVEIIYRSYILEFVFKIAVDLKWLWLMPKYADGIFKFSLNPNHFDKKETVKKIISNLTENI